MSDYSNNTRDLVKNSRSLLITVKGLRDNLSADEETKNFFAKQLDKKSQLQDKSNDKHLRFMLTEVG